MSNQTVAVQHSLLARSVELARNTMTAQHMSAKAFAEKAGLSPSTIYRHRAGKARNAYITTVDKMLLASRKKLVIVNARG